MLVEVIAVNLTPHCGSDECKHQNAPYNTDGDVQCGPPPIAFGDKTVVFCAEGAEGAESTTESNGQCCWQDMSFRETLGYLYCDDGQQGSGEYVGGQCASGDKVFSVEPYSQQMTENGSGSSADENTD